MPTPLSAIALSILVDDAPDALHEGYCTLVEYRWIWETCFGDSRAQFLWEKARVQKARFDEAMAGRRNTACRPAAARAVDAAAAETGRYAAGSGRPEIMGRLAPLATGCALISWCYVATHYNGWLYRGGRLVNNGLFSRPRYEAQFPRISLNVAGSYE